MLLNENLVIKNDKACMLLNLFSFRRKILSNTEEILVKRLIEKEGNEKKLDDEEVQFIMQLKAEGQIISAEKIELLDKLLQNEKKPEKNLTLDTLIFNLTYNCNLDCYYCLLNNFDCPEGYITKKKASEISEYINFYCGENNVPREINSIVFTGGEPLLDENIEVINFIAEQYPEAKITIKTNGVNLYKNLRKLPVEKIERVDVSLDGMEELHTSRVRPKISHYDYCYDEIIKGIKEVFRQKIEVQISTVIDKYSYKELPKFIDFLNNNEILSNELCSIAINSTFDFSKPLGINEEYNNLEDILEMKKFLAKEIPEFYGNVALMTTIQRLESAVNRGSNIRLANVCRQCKPEAPVTLCFLPNGDVYFEDYIGKESMKVGNYKKPFKFDKNKLERLTTTRIYDFDKCKACVYRMVCSTGCPKYAYNSKGIPMCGIYKNQFLLDNFGRFIE